MVLTESGWYLLIAIPFGVLGTVSLKLSHGMQKWKPSVCLVILYFISFIALTLAIEGMDIGIVYAIWSGVGTMLIAVVGICIFKETVNFLKVISIFLIIIGVIGIHLSNVYY